MKHKESMQKAYKEKDAEYYTLYEDIAAELPNYKELLRGKRIICPCDWDESYNEELVYKEEGVMASDLFSNGSIKHLNLAASKDKFEKDFDAIKCQFVKFLVAHAEAYGIRSISVSGYNPQTGDGVKFQDVNYSNYDIVITNPPFSLFGEFIDVMMKMGKEFLVIGPTTALTYKNIAGYMHENRLWLGYAKQMKGFRRPDGTMLLSKDKDGSVPRACKWYTNLDVTYRHDRMTLTKSYYENPDLYPKYLNYDAIHVSFVKDIPYDYEGLMGVPTTIMAKYNPEQFEIVGSSIGLASKPTFEIPKNKRGGPAFYLPDGKGSVRRMFAMLVIRNLNPIKDDEL
ncbi:MAG: hypothetical protein J1E77_05650 [Prevotella sp.]|nr:hypothetical protein [Prevotella sp.]